MYAIAFDLKIDDLKKEYGEPYNKAYDEIRIELEKLGFRWVQGSIYISDNTQNSLVTVYNAINRYCQYFCANFFRNPSRSLVI